MLHVGSDDRHFSLSISRELSIEGASAAIQDTHFLFNTGFNRVGDDLESDGRIHIVANHFKLENLRDSGHAFPLQHRIQARRR